MSSFRPVRITQYRPKNAFFPEVPRPNSARAVILSSPSGDAILVTDNTTPAEVRRGKYDRLTEVDLRKYPYDLSIRSISADVPYEFELRIRATVRVLNPAAFIGLPEDQYDKTIIDQIRRYLKSITQNISIYDYSQVDEAILAAFYNDQEEEVADFGLAYAIKDVTVEPFGEVAKNLIKKKRAIRDQHDIIKAENETAEKLGVVDMRTAIISKVVRGEISQEKAIQELQAHQLQGVDHIIEMIERLRKVYPNQEELQRVTNAMLGDQLPSLPAAGGQTASQPQLTGGDVSNEDWLE